MTKTNAGGQMAGYLWQAVEACRRALTVPNDVVIKIEVEDDLSVATMEGTTRTDAPQSLAQYIARYLSQAIKDRNERGEPSTIEGRFISHQDLDAMQFTGNI